MMTEFNRCLLYMTRRYVTMFFKVKEVYLKNQSLSVRYKISSEKTDGITICYKNFTPSKVKCIKICFALLHN